MGAAHGGQDLAVARNPIQPFVVVGDLITTGPTAEHVRVLARLVVYEGIIPRPAEVFLGVQVSHNVIGPSPAVVLVLALPVVGVTAGDVVWARPASDEVVAETGVDFVPPVGADQYVVCLSASAGPTTDVAGVVRALDGGSRPRHSAHHDQRRKHRPHQEYRPFLTTDPFFSGASTWLWRGILVERCERCGVFRHSSVWSVSRRTYHSTHGLFAEFHFYALG